MRTAPRGEVANIVLKNISDLADSCWNVLVIVYCTLLGRNGSYWLAVVAERADDTMSVPFGHWISFRRMEIS